MPWDRFNLNLGVFISTLDSRFAIGGNNIGIGVDLEEALGLDTSISAFRIDALWRFTDNLRHRLDFSWFDLNRDATNVLDAFRLAIIRGCLHQTINCIADICCSWYYYPIPNGHWA